MNANSPIGVFDSGVGGISVLRELIKLMPDEHFIYYGDNANAPYGEKTEEQVRSLAWAVTERLLARDIKALVIACNTATSAAAPLIRSKLSIPVVAMEPALKPASLKTHGGKILVLATPVTLSLEKFHRLMELYGHDAIPVPCPGLMDIVERGEFDGPEIESYFGAIAEEYRTVAIDAVVLGCTHYVFLRREAQRAFPNAAIIDGNEGTARQLKRLLEEQSLLSDDGNGSVELISSGDTEDIEIMQRLLTVQIR